jgi:predicted alpha/beta hydrolase family esterase
MVEAALSIPLLLVPGWRNSGPEHWQSRWQQLRPQLARVDFGEWHHPEPQAWTAALRQAVLACPRPPLLIAHSLGCLATANLLAQPIPPPIAAALLVAPPNPGQSHAPPELSPFDPPARRRFGVPGLVVISSNDAYAEETYGLELAKVWGLEVVQLGACGHINDESGHGDWPQGLALLDGLISSLGS